MAAMASLIGQGGIGVSLRALRPAIHAKMHADMHAAAHVMYETAQTFVPVDTGFLRDSQELEISYNSARLTAPAPYAGFQEYGTKRHGPQSFMRPALRAGIAYLESQGYRPV